MALLSLRRRKRKQRKSTDVSPSVFDTAAANLITAVQFEYAKTSEGSAGSLAAQSLEALKGMGLEVKFVTGPVSGKDSSSAEEGKGKKRKTIDHLEEEEMRVVSKVQEDGN